MHRRPTFLVEAAQNAVAAQHQVDVDAEAVEDAGEFDGDVARPHDHDALGQLRQMERLVGGDRQFAARDRRDDRMAAGGDQDLLGGHGFVAHLDRMPVHQPATAHVQLHAGTVEQAQVDRVEAIDFPVHVVAQRRP